MADLGAFDAEVLHPGRTLIEKLLRINNFAGNPASRDGPNGWRRIGRQFYDIWALLGTAEVADFLADKPVVAEVLASCYAVSRAFTPDAPAPEGGFAASPAFRADSSLGTQLRAAHAGAMEGLYYGTDEPPSFDDVLERVHAHAPLLALT